MVQMKLRSLNIQEWWDMCLEDCLRPTTFAEISTRFYSEAAYLQVILQSTIFGGQGNFAAPT